MFLARLLRRVLCGAVVLASMFGGGATADTRAVGCGTSRVGEIAVATLHNAPIVTLVANGIPLTLLLDTGAEWTILTPTAAKRVGAQTPRIEFDRQIRGLSGSMATNEVELRSFIAGDVAIPWRRVRVASLNMPSVFSGPLDGVVGADTLSSFDIDLDLPHHRMVFYGKQSCPSAAPAWAEPYATIPVRKTFSNHLSFPAQLDGRRFDTFIDTGAQLSVLSSKAALALGVTDTVLSHDRATVTLGAAAERLNSHLHRFLHMEVGGEVVRNPALIVADVSLKDADLVLGVDFLGSRRIWYPTDHSRFSCRAGLSLPIPWLGFPGMIGDGSVKLLPLSHIPLLIPKGRIAMTPDELADAARNLAHALGITVYIRDGRIYQHGPGVEVSPPPGASPTAPGAPYPREDTPLN